jgi:hypothetical protein
LLLITLHLIKVCHAMKIVESAYYEIIGRMQLLVVLTIGRKFGFGGCQHPVHAFQESPDSAKYLYLRIAVSSETKLVWCRAHLLIDCNTEFWSFRHSKLHATHGAINTKLLINNAAIHPLVTRPSVVSKSVVLLFFDRRSYNMQRS